ncbi:MAG TPA: hypothetical protein EYO59_11825 [Chromatiaceae bacterium]|nr:hypothetical protein [Chromatiaceae bacterium]
MIATKDHFLFIIKNTEIKDELYAAEGYPAGNPIGFLAQGRAATFKKDSIEGPWIKYSESHDAPNLHNRSIKSLFGAVSLTDDIVYLTIIPRESAVLGEWEKLNNVSEDEHIMLQNSDTTFQVGSQCNVELCRDLETFGLVDLDVDDSLNIDLTFE